MKYLVMQIFDSPGSNQNTVNTTSGGANSAGLFGKITAPQGLFGGDPATAASSLLTLGIRLFFIFSAVTALVFMLRGAFDYITSGGEKEKVSGAQQRIYNALVGIIILIAVLALIATLEGLVFKGTFCFGLTCAIKIPHVQ